MSPQQLLDIWMQRTGLPPECAPRPGALSHNAKIAVVIDKAGIAIKVATEPANAEIETCSVAALTKQLKQFGPGTWTLEASRSVAIDPRVSDLTLTSALQIAAPTHATRCYEPGLDKRLTIAVSAKIGDTAFTIDVQAKSATFRRCVTDQLQTYLASALGSGRRNNEKVRYFRIDGAATATTTLEIRPPS